MKKFIGTGLCIAAINFAQAADVQPAIAEFNAMHFDKAQQLFAVAVKEPKHKDIANYYLGRIAFVSAKFEDAKDYLEESVNSEPQTADEFYWLGSVYGALAVRGSMFSAPGMLVKFRKSTEAALAINPAHLPSLISLYQFNVAAPGVMGGSTDKAEQILVKIDALSKPHGDIARLYTLNFKKEIDKVVALAQAMIAAHPSSDEALFEAGKILSSNKKIPEAVAAFEKITAENVSIENYIRVQGSYYEIGQAAFRAKANLDQGIAALRKATDPHTFPINGYTNWSYFRLAQLYQLKGDAAQQKKSMELLEKTGVEKDPLLVKAMEAASGL